MKIDVVKSSQIKYKVNTKVAQNKVPIRPSQPITTYYRSPMPNLFWSTMCIKYGGINKCKWLKMKHKNT